MRAPRVSEWDKATCLFLQGLGHLGSSALAKAQLCSGYPCVALLHAPLAGKLKLSSQKSTSGLVGPQLLESPVLFQLQKLVMSFGDGQLLTHSANESAGTQLGFAGHQFRLGSLQSELTRNVWLLSFSVSTVFPQETVDV